MMVLDEKSFQSYYGSSSDPSGKHLPASQPCVCVGLWTVDSFLAKLLQHFITFLWYETKTCSSSGVCGSNHHLLLDWTWADTDIQAAQEICNEFRFEISSAGIKWKRSSSCPGFKPATCWVTVRLSGSVRCSGRSRLMEPGRTLQSSPCQYVGVKWLVMDEAAIDTRVHEWKQIHHPCNFTGWEEHAVPRPRPSVLQAADRTRAAAHTACSFTGSNPTVGTSCSRVQSSKPPKCQTHRMPRMYSEPTEQEQDSLKHFINSCT